MTSQAVAQQLQQLTELGSPSAHNTETEEEVIARLDAEFMSWEDLIAAPKAGNVEASSSNLAKLELENQRWQSQQDDAQREASWFDHRARTIMPKLTFLRHRFHSWQTSRAVFPM
jgi:hypothetical protein